MVGCIASGLLAWLAGRSGRVHVPLLALGIIGVAIGAQLVPLPASALSVLSPAAIGTLERLDVVYAMQHGTHPLSIEPAATWHALGLFLSFVVLLVGLARLLSVDGSRWFLWSLTIVGAAVALFGIGQKALGDGITIYGFWTPRMPGNPFGPFVNRNHYAGWMLMALPACLAVIGSSLTHALHRPEPDATARSGWGRQRAVACCWPVAPPASWLWRSS
jgi:hypothetical protein